MANTRTLFVLTGDPGVGKTTLTKRLAAHLSEQGVKVSGFYTEEVRKNGVREGFDVVTLEGARGRLARDQGSLTAPVKYKVGKYGVLVQEFEQLAMPSLEKANNDKSHLLVIDEIGKMEFFSEPFKSRIKDIFSNDTNYIVLATIPIRKADPIIENIRNHKKAHIWTVTKENRNHIQDKVLNEMKLILKLN